MIRADETYGMLRGLIGQYGKTIGNPRPIMVESSGGDVSYIVNGKKPIPQARHKLVRVVTWNREMNPAQEHPTVDEYVVEKRKVGNDRQRVLRHDRFMLPVEGQEARVERTLVHPTDGTILARHTLSVLPVQSTPAAMIADPLVMMAYGMAAVVPSCVARGSLTFGLGVAAFMAVGTTALGVLLVVGFSSGVPFKRVLKGAVKAGAATAAMGAASALFGRGPKVLDGCANLVGLLGVAIWGVHKYRSRMSGPYSDFTLKPDLASREALGMPQAGQRALHRYLDDAVERAKDDVALKDMPPAQVRATLELDSMQRFAVGAIAYQAVQKSYRELTKPSDSKAGTVSRTAQSLTIGGMSVPVSCGATKEV